MKRFYVLLSVIVVSFWLYFLVAGIDYQAVVFAADHGNACETEIAEPDEDILTLSGVRYKVIDGGVYTCQKGKWAYSSSIIAGFGKKFEIIKTGDKCEIKSLQTGAKKTLTSHFSTGFEDKTFRDLFRPGGWSITTLLSPKANNVKKYMKLNRELMKGGKFRDNRIDLHTKNVRSGNNALRFYAVKPGQGMITSKSLVEKKDFCFAKGDHIWFSAWYYVEKGMPSTLVDFETRRFLGGPGIRVFIRRNKYVSMELKFADKPQYNQLKVPIPTKKWFNLKLHLLLSNHDDGLIELWQDETKILSTNGRTLPTHDTIYNSMQLGITATSRETTLLVDDVIVSNKPL